MPKSKNELIVESERLYSEYGQPLEQNHWGEYVAISPDGKTILGADLMNVSNRALDEFGRGSFVFKVGDKAVGKWRRASQLGRIGFPLKQIGFESVWIKPIREFQHFK